MTPEELDKELASKSGLTVKEAKSARLAVQASVSTAMGKSDQVSLVGFGTFEVRQRAARKGINPRTKEEIHIPTTKAPIFKTGKRENLDSGLSDTAACGAEEDK